MSDLLRYDFADTAKVIAELELRIAKLVGLLKEVDHTLVVHGHIDSETWLHERIRDVLTRK